MSLYPKLAWQSIRGNRRFYLPYAFALMGNVAAFYIMGALAQDASRADWAGAWRGSSPSSSCCTSTAS